jgi:hypothetical protein
MAVHGNCGRTHFSRAPKEIVSEVGKNKFIPVLRAGDWTSALPTAGLTTLAGQCTIICIGVHMKKVIGSLAIIPLLAAVLPAQRPWQQITVPSVRDVAANFKTPPREYGAIQPFWNLPSLAGSNLQNARERIVQDLDRLAANGVFVVNMAPVRGPHPDPKYLSPEHMSLVKIAVQEAAKRGMKLWLQDESDYPSGFAGGLIRKEYPQLRMQGIVPDIRVSVNSGQTLTMPLPPDTLGAFSVRGSDQSTEVIPLPANGQFEWTAPNEGSDPYQPQWKWTVVFVRHVYVSSPTRSFNREDGTRAKDALYSLIDYLDPDATRAFMKITHEVYKQAVGDEFGKTILGFFGDEPDYHDFIPWTPNSLW